jgi:hypothetical protein
MSIDMKHMETWYGHGSMKHEHMKHGNNYEHGERKHGT